MSCPPFGSRHPSPDTRHIVMIATKDSFEPSVLRPARSGTTEDRHSSESRTAGPKSKRVYVKGKLHPDVRVPMREIELTPTKSYTRSEERRVGKECRSR